VSIIWFQRAIVPVNVEGLAVIRSKSPVAARLLKAAAHRGLLAVARIRGGSSRALRTLRLATLVRVLLRTIGCAG
jgi:hypothetical protein